MIAQCETVTCWIALDDVLPDSGPMIFLEGSQKLGLYERPAGITGADPLRPRLPTGNAREVPVIIPAGAVSFHHGLTLHGSDVNNSGQQRRALVSHLLSGVCTYRVRNEHVNERAMQQYAEHPTGGEHFHGPQFPLVWPQELH
jgi:ectoine hydroxylase-related dioxygenase (phytanoyl-CoA dioxygenase family)